MAHWEVWNQNAPHQRIWRVNYDLVASQAGSPPVGPDRSDVTAEFKAALTRIHTFSQRHNCGEFTDCFRRALAALSGSQTRHGHHKDLCVPGTLSALSEAMLDAAQSAWVFGGMGSWNDMGFDGADAKEYERVSEQLFSVLNEAICVAANETDTA
jgi:hypothetical protein